MNDGRVLAAGLGIGALAGIAAATGAYLVAPPIHFPGAWSWVNAWGRIGVAFVAGWFVFVLSIALSIFAIVAKGFAEFDRSDGPGGPGGRL